MTPKLRSSLNALQTLLSDLQTLQERSEQSNRPIPDAELDRLSQKVIGSSTVMVELSKKQSN